VVVTYTEAYRGTSADELLATAKGALERAREMDNQIAGLQEQVSLLRWQAADAMLVLTERGWSRQRVADELGLGRATVSRYVQMAELHPEGARPPWTAVFYEVSPSNVKDAQEAATTKRILRDGPPNLVAEIVGALTQERQQLLVRSCGKLDVPALLDELLGPDDPSVPRRVVRRRSGRVDIEWADMVSELLGRLASALKQTARVATDVSEVMDALTADDRVALLHRADEIAKTAEGIRRSLFREVSG